MNPIVITLIVIRILTIIISFFIADKNTGKPENIDLAAVLEDNLTDESKKLIREKTEAVLSDISEEIIVRTDDALDKLSNEKIMAVNDFSEQILEKIRRNHEEVVFLYSMLEEKEKELKATVKEIDLSKKKMQSMHEMKSKEGSHTNQADVVNAEKEGTVAAMEHTDRQRADTKTDADVSGSEGNAERINNRQILELYSQGKSVLEISKMLGLGQGEVKLVIDLYKGKK